MSNATVINGVLGYTLSTSGTATTYIRADALNLNELAYVDAAMAIATAASIPLATYLSFQTYAGSIPGLALVGSNALAHFSQYSLVYDTAAPFNALRNFSVGSVTVTAGGTGYTSAPTVVFTPHNGSGAAAQCSITAGAVSQISVTAAGTGYNAVPTVVFSGGGGTGASGTAVISNSGKLISVTIVSGGTGYTSAPAIAFTPTGTGSGTSAAGTASIDYQTVISATVTAGGTGYTSAPTVAFSGGAGTGAAASAIVVGGAVVAVVITNVGSGYTSAPTIAFSGGAGSAAAATAVVGAGSVKSVAITAYGTGYQGNAPIVTFTGGAGANAAGFATLTPAIQHESADNLAAVVNALATEVVRLTRADKYKQ